MTGAQEPLAGWTLHYDGLKREVVLTSARADRHVVALTDVEELAHPHLRACRALGAPDGPLLWLRVDLDPRGSPLAWPAGLDARVLGSLTVWPKSESHYLWRHALTAFPELGDMPARELGPVEEPVRGADPEWVLWLRQGQPVAPQNDAAGRFEPLPVPHHVHLGWAPEALDSRLLFEGEGGSVSTARLDAEFVVVVNEVAMVDIGGLGPGMTTYRFATAHDRAAFLEDRGWPAVE